VDFVRISEDSAPAVTTNLFVFDKAYFIIIGTSSFKTLTVFPLTSSSF